MPKTFTFSSVVVHDSTLDIAAATPKPMMSNKATRTAKRKRTDQPDDRPTQPRDLMDSFAVDFIRQDGAAIRFKQKIEEIRNSNFKSTKPRLNALINLCDALKDVLKIILDYQNRFKNLKTGSAKERQEHIGELNFRKGAVRREIREILANLKDMGTTGTNYARPTEEMLEAIDPG